MSLRSSRNEDAALDGVDHPVKILISMIVYITTMYDTLKDDVHSSAMRLPQEEADCLPASLIASNIKPAFLDE